MAMATATSDDVTSDISWPLVMVYDVLELTESRAQKSCSVLQQFKEKVYQDSANDSHEGSKLSLGLNIRIKYEFGTQIVIKDVENGLRRCLCFVMRNNPIRPQRR